MKVNWKLTELDFNMQESRWWRPRAREMIDGEEERHSESKNGIWVLHRCVKKEERDRTFQF